MVRSKDLSGQGQRLAVDRFRFREFAPVREDDGKGV